MPGRYKLVLKQLCRPRRHQNHAKDIAIGNRRLRRIGEARCRHHGIHLGHADIGNRGQCRHHVKAAIACGRPQQRAREGGRPGCNERHKTGPAAGPDGDIPEPRQRRGAPGGPANGKDRKIMPPCIKGAATCPHKTGNGMPAGENHPAIDSAALLTRVSGSIVTMCIISWYHQRRCQCRYAAPGQRADIKVAIGFRSDCQDDGCHRASPGTMMPGSGKKITAACRAQELRAKFAANLFRIRRRTGQAAAMRGSTIRA